MSASSDQDGAGTGPDGEIPAPDDWSEAETWAWAEIRAGRPADFNERLGELDPKDPEGWDDTRKLGQAFLEDILLHDPYRGAIPRQGVRIFGAWLPDPIDLANASVENQLVLDQCRFESKVELSDMKILGLLSLEGTCCGDVDLRSAKVIGQLVMDGSRFDGTLVMDGLQVGRDLSMANGAEFAEVVLRGAEVGGQLKMIGSKFGGTLVMDGLQVDGDLFMDGCAEFSGVNLIGATVGGQLAMIKSRFHGSLDMDHLKVNSALILRGAAFEKRVDLVFANIGSNLDISGARFESLDVTGTMITGELRLGSGEHPATEWGRGARLVLRNSQVGALQDREEAWPESLELEGFTYGRLGGFAGARAEDDMAKRPAGWFIDWLAKDRTFSPQPYRQLAEVFHAAGQTDKAHAVLYAGRERERRAAEGVCWWTSGWKWWGMFWLMITIGYGLGYRYFRALAWVAVLILLGAIVLWLTGEGPANGMPWGLSYSLDHLLPVVQLIKSHYAIELDGFARYYFYVHKLMGYVLASFLIAGLAGLTQK